MAAKFLEWFKYAAIGLLTFLCVCWVLHYGNVASTCWTEMSSMFLITFLILSQQKKKISDLCIVSAVWIGAIIAPAMVKIIDWDNTTQAAPMFLCALTIGVLLAFLCYNYKNWVTYIVALLCAISYNSVLVELWENSL